MTSNEKTRPVSGDGAVGSASGTGRPAGQWVIELPAGTKLLNANDRMHWAAKARVTRTIRELSTVLARQAKVPALSRASITAEYRPPDRRKRDVHNLYPSAKAAIDGLVDAGVLPDDSDQFLTGPDMRAGSPVAGGQLVLHITRGVA